MLEFDPVIGRFRATQATLDVVTFRVLLMPYPPEDWAKKFNISYPVLPAGVETWFRSPGILDIECPLNLLRNVKHRLQTFVNEVNLWYEKNVLPGLSTQEEAFLGVDREKDDLAKKLEDVVTYANTVLEERFALDGLLFE